MKAAYALIVDSRPPPPDGNPSFVSSRCSAAIQPTGATPPDTEERANVEISEGTRMGRSAQSFVNGGGPFGRWPLVARPFRACAARNHACDLGTRAHVELGQDVLGMMPGRVRADS